MFISFKPFKYFILFIMALLCLRQQSLENVQLLNVVGELQSELADCKGCLKSSRQMYCPWNLLWKRVQLQKLGFFRCNDFKEKKAQDTVTACGQLLSLDISRTWVWSRKPGLVKTHVRLKEHYEKVILEKVDNEPAIQQTNNGNGETWYNKLLWQYWDSR